MLFLRKRPPPVISQRESESRLRHTSGQLKQRKNPTVPLKACRRSPAPHACQMLLVPIKPGYLNVLWKSNILDQRLLRHLATAISPICSTEDGAGYALSLQEVLENHLSSNTDREAFLSISENDLPLDAPDVESLMEAFVCFCVSINCSLLHHFQEDPWKLITYLPVGVHGMKAQDVRFTTLMAITAGFDLKFKQMRQSVPTLPSAEGNGSTDNGKTKKVRG